MRRNTMGALVGIALVALSAGCSGGGRTEGQRRLDELTSEIDSLVEAFEEGRAELTTTLAAHDAVVNNRDGDLLTPFASFHSGLDGVEDSWGEVRERIEGVKGAAEPYFETWSRTLDKFTSEELRRRSRERMARTRERYETIRKKAEEARDRYDSLIPLLRDHALFLSSDLNAESAADLREDDEKIKGEADAIFTIVDEVVAGANRYHEAVAMRAAPAAGAPEGG